MKADLSYLDHNWRAKRTAMCPAEYAASVQRFGKRKSWTGFALRFLAAVLVLTVLAGMLA